MLIKQVGLNNQRKPWFAVVALQSDGDQIPSLHCHPAVSDLALHSFTGIAIQSI
jgi:hypothetical protein